MAFQKKIRTLENGDTVISFIPKDHPHLESIDIYVPKYDEDVAHEDNEPCVQFWFHDRYETAEAENGARLNYAKLQETVEARDKVNEETIQFATELNALFNPSPQKIIFGNAIQCKAGATSMVHSILSKSGISKEIETAIMTEIRSQWRTPN